MTTNYEVIGTTRKGVNVNASYMTQAEAIKWARTVCESFEVRRLRDDVQVHVEYPRTSWA